MVTSFTFLVYVLNLVLIAEILVLLVIISACALSISNSATAIFPFKVVIEFKLVVILPDNPVKLTANY